MPPSSLIAFVRVAFLDMLVHSLTGSAARDVTAVRAAIHPLLRWLRSARLDPVLYVGARALLDAAGTLQSCGTELQCPGVYRGCVRVRVRVRVRADPNPEVRVWVRV